MLSVKYPVIGKPLQTLVRVWAVSEWFRLNRKLIQNIWPILWKEPTRGKMIHSADSITQTRFNGHQRRKFCILFYYNFIIICIIMIYVPLQHYFILYYLCIKLQKCVKADGEGVWGGCGNYEIVLTSDCCHAVSLYFFLPFLVLKTLLWSFFFCFLSKWEYNNIWCTTPFTEVYPNMTNFLRNLDMWKGPYNNLLAEILWGKML